MKLILKFNQNILAYVKLADRSYTLAVVSNAQHLGLRKNSKTSTLPKENCIYVTAVCCGPVDANKNVHT